MKHLRTFWFIVFYGKKEMEYNFLLSVSDMPVLQNKLDRFNTSNYFFAVVLLLLLLNI